MQWSDIQIAVPAMHTQVAQDVALCVSNAGIYVEDQMQEELALLKESERDIHHDVFLCEQRTHAIIHLYVSECDDKEEIMQILHEKMKNTNLPYVIKDEQIKQEDWENSWKAYYKPIEIGERLAIVPCWQEFETQRIKVNIDPGMAFGTGTHESTSLCLLQLDKLIKGGERVLDIGTGSGILAISAVKLGAKSADAIDIDPMCVKIAAENSQINGTQNSINVHLGDLSEKATGIYDIICANIIASIIIKLAPSIKPLLSENGVFIAAGIIEERLSEVQSAIISAGLSIEHVLRKNGWVALVIN